MNEMASAPAGDSSAATGDRGRALDTSGRRCAPVWLKGLTYSVFGMYGGIVAVSVPQLLAWQHVPESTIATASAVIISPAFWCFLLSPVLDVRFSRRWYSLATASAAAALLVMAVLALKRVLLFEVFLTAGFLSASLYQGALGGWLASITRSDDEHRLSVWVNIGNICAGGAMAMLTGELVTTLAPVTAALILGAAILAPTLVFLWMPAPPADISGARGSFMEFLRDLRLLLRRREVLWALLLFAAPVATFSLTNFLGGLGHDFHASTHFVGLLGGSAVVIGGACGCFAFPLIDRLLPLRPLYLAIGVAGALFTLTLILAPHVPWAFAVAMIGQNAFQALAFTAGTAITLVAIGRGNPLSATAWSLMFSIYNLPITYMLLIDGAGYGWHGVSGSFLADGAVSLTACLVLALCLFLSSRGAPAGSTSAPDVSSAKSG
ncbi:MAG: MFS transporter [Gammaproteobacteria bacterium]|nr:MFS transporter [Gammaproteobacteria bacterium]